MSPASTPAPQTSLRRDLLRRLLIPLLILFAVSGSGTYWLAIYFSNAVYDAWLYDSVNSLALLVDRVGDHASCDLPVAAKEVFLWNESDTTYFTVRGDRSGVLVSNILLPAVPADADQYRNASLFDGDAGRIHLRIIALELSPERAGEHVWVQVAETGIKRQRLARAILLAVLVPQIVLIIAAVAAVSLGVTRGLRPLARLSRRLASQKPASLQQIPDAGVPDEILPLTQALNALLTGLHDLLDRQRKFIADAAHQLRTPLTGIKLNSERAIKESSEVARPTLELLRVSADRAARLANQLLSLARAEYGLKGVTHNDRVDVLAVARERGAEWVTRALAKNIELSLVRDQDPIFLRGDAALICEALDNLLDNAIKYHPGNGQIVLAVNRAVGTGDKVRITVEDDGPGIAPELRLSVFERFNRGDRYGNDGSGLGLAIVAEIAAALRGRAWIEGRLADHGTRVSLELPAWTEGSEN